MARRSEIKGMRELEKTLKTLERLPQKCVTKAARKGGTIALRAAKKNAPVDSGNLKKGLVLKGERAKIKGKKVYQVTLDKSMNDVFVKESSTGNRSYYPASQEYGWMDQYGKYTPGFRYMRKSLDDNNEKIEETVVEVLTKEIDKLE
ncbi:hypothetical protein AM500_21390 [Bacillus sp. FJAT-18017]|uniref:HK97-gp10 family putative phage morphogenesis protein n=1 Tax=Bacillus sp. FJAT-18017 TaxID=1705566 RepID=UPI0006AD9EFE|nr:HK97-gp10 family putative phage morphogenesis protein [Bacillus sp. FJAT-18017]ALC92063.1 hypothetical protein AM500_21390 [Bacillus sp. FJAT-18017]